MKKYLSLFISVLAFALVITQYYLMIENRVLPIGETTLRFFTFFTILTNSIVAVFFMLDFRKTKNGQRSAIDKPGISTAVTLYIAVVGLTYQVLLRHLWHPSGLQMIVDECLHSVIPAIVVIYWFKYADKSSLEYRQIPKWLIYPLVYLLYVLISGHFTNYYPYPFVDVSKFGITQVLINSTGLVVMFVAMALGFVWIGKANAKTTN